MDDMLRVVDAAAKIASAISGGMMDSLLEALGLLVVTTVGGWLGSYYGSYAAKKGENKAIHEDIQKLVDQVSAVTLEQEQIKAAISGDLWNKQAVLTMKRECYVSLITSLAELERAVDHDGGPDFAQFGLDASKEVTAAARAFVRARAIASFVLDETANGVLDALNPTGEQDVWKWTVVAIELRLRMVVEAQRELGLAPVKPN